MNILPTKSWHVRTKKNIERVRRDEEKAAEEEKERQRKIALAEQEARTELLRSRAHKSIGGPEGKESKSAQMSLVASTAGPVDMPSLKGKSGHINFFKDIEDGLTKEGKNKEHEADKKKEQEELEKKIGLLTYLGQTALDEKTSGSPWYLKEKSRDRKSSNKEVDGGSDEEDNDLKIRMALQHKHREFLDPLEEMKQYVKKKNKHKKKHKSKDKEKKKDRARKGPSTSVSSSSSGSSGKKTIEQLRADRLEREKKEKNKSQMLLSGGGGSSREKGGGESSREKGGGGGRDDGSSSSSSGDEEEERRERRGGKRKYNSQFHDNLVRPSKVKRNEFGRADSGGHYSRRGGRY